MTARLTAALPAPLSLAIEATGMLDPKPTGITRYTRCLIEALSSLPVAATEEFSLTQLWRSSRWRYRQGLLQGTRLATQMWRDGLWPLRCPYEVVHVPHNRVPPWRRPAYVATIHDLYAALGINHDDPQQRERQLQVYRHLAMRSHRLICVSEHTRQDFLRLVGGDPERIHTVHLGVSPQFRPHTDAELAPLRASLARDHGIERPYVLFVGYANPNKNIQRLLQAYANSPVRDHYDLALTGSAPPAEQARFDDSIAALGIQGRVKSLGYIADAQLPALYAGAAAYLFPSLYEGFGLPILEAMASGVPVLTSTVASCPEVAAGHAELVDPLAVDQIAAGLERVVTRTPAQCAAALSYARSKTWTQTAQQTLAIYQLALDDHRAHRTTVMAER